MSLLHYQKKPPEEGFEDTGLFGAAFLGDSVLFANCDPTALSKNPFEVPAAEILMAKCHR